MPQLDDEDIRLIRQAIEDEDDNGDRDLAAAIARLLERLEACEERRAAAEERVGEADAIVFADRAARDVILERRRQVEMGRDAHHDDVHTEGELLSADWGAIRRLTGASSWLRSGLVSVRRRDGYVARYRELLVEGAALTLAEIERIDRAQPSEA